MSETSNPKESLHPESHFLLIRAAQSLVAARVGKDQENGEDSITLFPTEGPDGTAGTKPKYDLYLTVPKEWKGKFFDQPGGSYIMHAPMSREDPEQVITITATYLDIAAEQMSVLEDSDSPVFRMPHKAVTIPLAESIPDLRDEPRVTIDSDEARQALPAQLSNPEALDLIEDFASLAEFQQ